MAARANLRRFLLDARAKLSPDEFDVPSTGRRRVLGLRREEVAERAGISDTWYARFEAGRAQLSHKSLLRVASALRLSPRETIELVRLASPSPASDSAIDHFGQGTAELRAVRRLFRALQAAGSISEVRTHLVGALLEIAHSPSVAFCVEETAPEAGFHFLESAGPHESYFHGRYEAPSVMAHFDRERLLSMPVSESLVHSPSAEHRANAVRTGSEHYRTVPVQPISYARSMRIGWASREAGPFPAVKSVAHDLIGDYARWTLTQMISLGSS
jgi:transcriptional regulator with XRE-family HTH domain